MICLILNWFVYDPSWMLHLSEFVRTLRSAVLVVINNFILIDATARSKISSDQKRFFIALSLYPFSFFANTPFKEFVQSSLKSYPEGVTLYNFFHIYLVILYVCVCVSVNELQGLGLIPVFNQTQMVPNRGGARTTCLFL